MNTELTQPETQRMDVTVYLVDRAPPPFPLPQRKRWGESAHVLSLEMRCLSRETVYDECTKSAAARAFYNAVTVYRHEQLCDLNAPPEILARHANPQAVAAQLAPFGLLPGDGYILDNQVQVWLIDVRPRSTPKRRRGSGRRSPRAR
ncbi:MAG TPA: hypothetical protein PJ982_17930 [Lacipirellulaceae bacterium]|nr:hypothetical protein [Lacipirellulaceae bacterium]